MAKAARISEQELILPSLYFMVQNGGRITTRQLIRSLRAVMPPEGEDAAILAKRSDDKYSQKVRNLRSHNTFGRKGYAQYGGAARNAFVEITAAGRQHLRENEDFLRYLLVNDFSHADVAASLTSIERQPPAARRRIQTFDENTTIVEGVPLTAPTQVYQRSRLLRDYAIEQFTADGRIACRTCSFDFLDFYGEVGRGFIEIHHIRPVFQYEGDDMERTLAQALANVAPVCANCHRMIHRRRATTLSIAGLMAAIDANGRFNDAHIRRRR